MNSLSLSFGVGLPSHLEGVLFFVCRIKLLSCNWKKKKKFSPPPPAQCYRSFRWVAQQVEQYDKSFISLAPDYSLSWLLLLLARLPENDKGHDDSDHVWWVKINPSSVGNFTARPISSAQLNQILLGYTAFIFWIIKHKNVYTEDFGNLEERGRRSRKLGQKSLLAFGQVCCVF